MPRAATSVTTSSLVCGNACQREREIMVGRDAERDDEGKRDRESERDDGGGRDGEGEGGHRHTDG